MAQLTGKLAADFTDFVSACEKAEVSLKGFETGADSVQQKLDKVGNAYSGTKTIQEATLAARAIDQIGGVSQLTAAELAKVGATAQEAAAKLTAMGQNVPPGIQNLADAAKDAGTQTTFLSGAVGMLAGVATVGAFARLATEVITDADALQNMSERTSISIEGLQRLDVIARQNGATMEDVGKAVFQMGRRIAGDNASADSAVRELGLDLNAIKSMRPEDAFTVLGTAIGKLPDPFKQSELGAALFGRSVQDLIPVFKNLEESTGRYSALSADQVGALHSMEQAWQRVSISVELFKMADETLHLTQLKEDIDIVTGAINKMPAVIDPWTDAMKRRVAPEIASGLMHEQEIITDLTKTMNEQNAAAKKAADIQAAALEETTKLWDDYATRRTEDEGAFSAALSKEEGAWDAAQFKTDAAQAKVDKYFLDLAAKMQKAGTDTAAFYDAWSADWDAASAHIQTGEDALLLKYEQAEAQHLSLAEAGVNAFGASATTVIAGVGAAADAAAAKIASMWGTVASRGGMGSDGGAVVPGGMEALAATAGMTSAQAAAWNAANQKAWDSGSSTTYNLTTPIGIEAFHKMNPSARVDLNDAQLMAAAKTGVTLEQMVQAGLIDLYAGLEAQYGGLQHYASGGPVLQDGPIYAHAGEFVTPAGVGGNITVPVMLDGNLIANVVINRLTGQIRQQRLFPARA